MVKFLSLFLLGALLTGCMTSGMDLEAQKVMADTERSVQLAREGKIKWSEHFSKFALSISKMSSYSGKSDDISDVFAARNAALAYENGTMTKDKFDELRLKIGARFEERAAMRERAHNQRVKNAWIGALQKLNEYNMQRYDAPPEQPTYKPKKSYTCTQDYTPYRS